MAERLAAEGVCWDVISPLQPNHADVAGERILMLHTTIQGRADVRNWMDTLVLTVADSSEWCLKHHIPDDPKAGTDEHPRSSFDG